MFSVQYHSGSLSLPQGQSGYAAHQLDLRLIDAALAGLACAGDCMQYGAARTARDQLMQAQRCVGELRASIDLVSGGPLAAHLDDVCEYVARQLSAAQRQNLIGPVMEVSHLLHEVRAAWVTLSHV